MKKLILNNFQKLMSMMLTAILFLSTISFEVFAADPKVSITIPVYNTPENLLRNCLESAKNQTLKDIEIICVDDGSTDGSGKILDEYAKSDPRFVVVHTENAGWPTARNKALDLARGEYVQFLDSDDTIDPTMSEKCYNKAKEHDADIVKCGFSSDHMWAKSLNKNEVLVGPVFDFGGSCGEPCVIWRGIWRRIFSNGDKIYFYCKARRFADVSFTFMYYPKANKVVSFSDKLYHYSNKNINSLVKTHPHKISIQSVIENVNFIQNNWNNSGYFSKDGAKIRFLKLVLSNFTFGRMPKDCLKNCLNSELISDRVMNQLTVKERIRLKSVLLIADSKPQKTLDDGIYTISSKLDPNKCLDIDHSSKDDKANLQLWQKNGTDAQKFKIQYHSDGYYTIEAICSGKFIDVSSSGKQNRTNIWQYSGNGTDAQKWFIVPDGEGYYCFLPKCNNLCMDVSNSKTNDGTNIRCWSLNGSDAQRFKLEKCEDKPVSNKPSSRRFGNSKKSA